MAWYDKKWVIWLAIIIFPPIGLLLMFRSPNFSTKAKGIVTVVILLILIIGQASKDKNTPPVAKNAPAPKVEQAETGKFFANGQFKVGTDLSAGEYIAVGTGYVEVSKSSSGGVDNILINDNIENARRYVIANDGEYVKVTGDIKLYPLADAPKIDTSGKLAAGEYKVGSDIKSGEYKITLDAGGYYAVTSDARRAIVRNQFTNEGGSYYATVSDGQYLQIKKGVGGYVGATEVAEKTAPAPQPAPKPAPPPKTAKVLSLGMTFEQFKESYKNNAVAITGMNINVDNAQIKEGPAQNVFQSPMSQDVIVMGSIDKANGQMKEAWVICKSNSDSMLDAIIAYGLIMSVVNPEMTTEQRGSLMGELKLNERITELATTEGRAIRGNVRYMTKYVPNGDFFMLSASAKDL